MSYLESAGDQLTFGGSATINVSGLANGINVTASGAISDDTLQNFGLTVAEGASFTVDGASVTATAPLALSYVASPTSEFTFSGAASVLLPDLSQNPISVTAAGTVSANELQSLSLTIATTASISLAGVTVTTSSSNPFVLTYDSGVLDLSGNAKVLLPGTSGSINVSATGTIVNRYFTTLTLTAIAEDDPTVAIGGLTIAPSDLTLTYDGPSVLTITGDASVAFPIIGAYAVHITGSEESDILDSFELDVTALTSFNVDGVAITPSTMSFAYLATTGFTVAGSASVAFPTFGTYATSISGAIDTAGTLQSLAFAVTGNGTAITIGGVAITPESLTLTYTGATGSTPATTTLSGTATAKIPSFGTVATSLTGTLSNDAIQTLALTVTSNGSLTVESVLTVHPEGLTFTYTAGSGFSIGGAASVTVPTFGSIFVTAAGTFDTSGDLQTFMLTATSASASSISGA